MKIERKKRPIKLHLGVGDGDVLEIEVEDQEELISYILEADISYPNKVWLATSNGEIGEIYISESIHEICDLIEGDFLAFANTPIFVFENESYESAYAVSLSMREGNPLCYDSQIKK